MAGITDVIFKVTEACDNKSILFHESNDSPSNGDSVGEIKWASRVDKTVTAQIKSAAFNNNNGTDGVLTFWTANDTSSGDSANHLKETFRIDQLGRTLIGNERTTSDLAYYDDLTINNSNAASAFILISSLLPSNPTIHQISDILYKI